MNDYQVGDWVKAWKEVPHRKGYIESELKTGKIVQMEGRIALIRFGDVTVRPEYIAKHNIKCKTKDPDLLRRFINWFKG